MIRMLTRSKQGGRVVEGKKQKLAIAKAMENNSRRIVVVRASFTVCLASLFTVQV